MLEGRGLYLFLITSLTLCVRDVGGRAACSVVYGEKPSPDKSFYKAFCMGMYQHQ